jgi:hypothetical protein
MNSGAENVIFSLRATGSSKLIAKQMEQSNLRLGLPSKLYKITIFLSNGHSLKLATTNIIVCRLSLAVSECYCE